ncbi:MAG: adenosylcobinamide-GDP ribazoletransferase [Clostridiales bacterium]|nr:adenosylcobinamide-GDP ribazoletransferase [Clostridiales bacterium]
MRLIRSAVIAFSTYSRLPMPQVEWTDENRRYSMCFFPLVGAVIGGLVWLWLCVCGWLELNALVKGAVGAVIPLLVTGGIHMDGFMDTTDALASWQPREKKLEILKDSHVGAFAVMGCASYMLLMTAFLSMAKPQAGAQAAVCFVLSRALSALAVTVLKSARPEGMLDKFASASKRRMVSVSGLIYVLVCGVIWCLWEVWLALILVAVAAAVTLYYKRMSEKQFGGVTGDLAGWYSQMLELCLIIAAVMGVKLL